VSTRSRAARGRATGRIDGGRAAKRAFDALADGSQAQMPLGRTFWSPRFGMLTDRFGVGWMVGVFQ
jgi:uncharacterized glyoxalase superfamily protein PhnB